jgi:hypothetical protein
MPSTPGRAHRSLFEAVTVRHRELVVGHEFRILGHRERIVGEGEDDGEAIGQVVLERESFRADALGIDEEVLAETLAAPLIPLLVVVSGLALVLVVSLDQLEAAVSVQIALPGVRHISDEGGNEPPLAFVLEKISSPFGLAPQPGRPRRRPAHSLMLAFMTLLCRRRGASTVVSLPSGGFLEPRLLSEENH